jgi:SH3 domain protein
MARAPACTRFRVRHRTGRADGRRLRSLRPVLILLLLAGLSAGPGPVQAAQGDGHWIHDQLRVDMRSGPSFEYRIIDFLPTGTPVTVLEDQGEWLRVEARGDEGWIQAQYVTDQPVASLRLSRLQQEHAGTQAQLREARARVGALQEELAALETSHDQASEAVDRLREELERIRAVSASALATAAERDALADEAARLRDQVEALSADNAQLRSDNLVEGLQWGAGAVLAGVLVAWLTAAFAGRRKQSTWA